MASKRLADDVVVQRPNCGVNAFGRITPFSSVKDYFMVDRRLQMISYGVAAGLLVILVWSIGTGEVAHALGRITIPSMIALLAVSGALILVSVIKWRAFLRLFSPVPTVWRLSELYLVGYFVNLFLPSRIGGDLVRSLSLARPGGRTETIICTFLERLTGLLAMLLIACCGLLITRQSPLITAVVLLLAAAGWGAAVALWLGIPARWFPWPRVSSLVERMERSLDAVRGSIPVVIQSLSLSLLFHGLTVVNTQVAAWAIGAPAIAFGDLFVVLPLILLLGSIPLTPQGLGVQEGMWVFFLGQVGVSPADSLAISLVLRAKSYLLGMVGCIVVVRDYGWRLGMKRVVGGSLEETPSESSSAVFTEP